MDKESKLKSSWNNLWTENNVGNTIGSLAGGLTGAIGAGVTATQIKDTTEDVAGINAVGNTQFSTGNFNNLLAQFDVNNMANTNYTAEDLQLHDNPLGNALLAGVNGFANSFPFGGLIKGGINAALGVTSSLIGSGIAKNNARAEAARLNSLAEEANARYLNNFTNAVNNTQNTMFNNSLLNIASYGGPIFDLSGDFSNGLTFINEGGTHGENPFGGVLMGVDQEGTPNLVEEGEIIFNDYVFSNRLKPTKKQLADGGFTDKYEGWTFAKIVEDLQKEASERPNDIISKAGLEDMMSRVMMMQEEIRIKKESKNNTYKYGGSKGNMFEGIGEDPNFIYKPTLVQDEIKKWQDIVGRVKGLMMPPSKNVPVIVEDIIPEIEGINIDTSYELPDPQYMHVDEDGKAVNISDDEFKQRLNDGTAIVGDEYKPKKFNRQNVLRYASPIIHGINLLNNLKKPDYSGADRIEQAAYNIPGGSYTPIGDYLKLQEVDPNVLVNPILANAAANRRALQNQGANAAAVQASLLGSNYLTNKAIAEGLIQGIQTNNTNKSTEAQFNRGTNQTNMQAGLTALGMDQQRGSQILNATAQADQQRNQLDAMRSQAIGNSITGLAGDFGSIGRESMDRGMLQGLIDSGALMDLFKDKTTANEGKNGGYLTRRRKK